MSSKSTVGGIYPPTASSCPDYWQTVTTDPSSCMIPTATSRNSGKIYDVATGLLTLNSSTTYGFDNNSNSINFSDHGWTKGGMNSACSQKAWANQYGVVWDGVSNFNSC